MICSKCHHTHLTEEGTCFQTIKQMFRTWFPNIDIGSHSFGLEINFHYSRFCKCRRIRHER